MDLSDERQPFASPKTGSTMTLNDEFSLKELTEQQEDIKEQDLTPRALWRGRPRGSPAPSVRR